jgi:hypothetical protein
LSRSTVPLHAWSALAHEVIDFLARRGFVLFDLAGSLRRPFEDDLAQLDLVFVPPTAILVKTPAGLTR